MSKMTKSTTKKTADSFNEETGNVKRIRVCSPSSINRNIDEDIKRMNKKMWKMLMPIRQTARKKSNLRGSGLAAQICRFLKILKKKVFKILLTLSN